MIRFLDARRTGGPWFPGLDDDHITRALVAAAFYSLALFFVTTPAWLTDPRMLDGAHVWLKPQKFNLSFIVHFMTLAILAQQMPRQVRAGPTLYVFTYLALGSIVFESIYVMVQAARARRSHFNYETQLESGLYALMGIGALLLVFVAVAIAVQVWRKGQRDMRGYRLGTILGLIFGAFTTIGFAGYMSMSGSHWVGNHPPGGAEIPLFGWSREVGDLRPAHFVAMHMMQTLPLIGYVMDRIGGPGRLAVIIAFVVQMALAAFLFFQGLSGAPFWPG